MADFIGIAVPQEVSAEIEKFRGRYQSPDEEPYIALISSDALYEAESLRRKLQSFCLTHAPVKTIVGGPYIDNGVSLNLTVIPGMPLNKLRDRLFGHLNIPRPAGVFRAHVSLIKGWNGGESGLEEALAEAKLAFAKPQSIYVSAISIYARAKTGDAYRPVKSYPLTGR